VRAEDRTSPSTLDWTALRERLARASIASTDTAITDAARREILARRARALATVVDATAAEDLGALVVQFVIGDETYAVACSELVEVARLRDCVRLPGAPAFVRGIAHVRGRILTVVDLPRMFGRTREIGSGAVLIVIGRAGAEVGVAADELTGMRTIATDSLAPPPTTLGRIGAASCRGITADGVIVLDTRILTEESR
jgi:purine-binding chemotaxis protein CheW